MLRPQLVSDERSSARPSLARGNHASAFGNCQTSNSRLNELSVNVSITDVSTNAWSQAAPDGCPA